MVGREGEFEKLKLEGNEISRDWKDLGLLEVSGEFKVEFILMFFCWDGVGF